MHQNSSLAGALHRTPLKELTIALPPKPVVGWEGDASPYFPPFDAFGLSIWASLALCFLPSPPPIHIPGYATTRYARPVKKFWLRYCMHVSYTGRLLESERVTRSLSSIILQLSATDVLKSPIDVLILVVVDGSTSAASCSSSQRWFKLSVVVSW